MKCKTGRRGAQRVAVDAVNLTPQLSRGVRWFRDTCVVGVLHYFFAPLGWTRSLPHRGVVLSWDGPMFHEVERQHAQENFPQKRCPDPSRRPNPSGISPLSVFLVVQIVSGGCAVGGTDLCLSCPWPLTHRSLSIRRLAHERRLCRRSRRTTWISLTPSWSSPWTKFDNAYSTTPS